MGEQGERSLGRAIVDALYGREVISRQSGRPRVSHRVGASERRVLLVMVEPSSAGLRASAVAQLAGVSPERVLALWGRADFRERVRVLREAAYPGLVEELKHRIAADALEPLATATNPDALIRTREQAGAFLGVPLKAPEVVMHGGQVDHVHRIRWERYPVEAQEAFARGEPWDEARFGAPPWVQVEEQAGPDAHGQQG